ncbi:MAG: hypothetical protein AAGD38_21945 [Acidobacteriota bacterium]
MTYLDPAGDQATLEALGMHINTTNRTVHLPSITIELDFPLRLQGWTVRGIRRAAWNDGSVLKPSVNFTDPAGYGALVFCRSARVDLHDFVVDAEGQVETALELNTSHGSHVARVTGARGTRACIAVRNCRGITALQCLATGWNETGRIVTGTGWLVEQYDLAGTPQKPSQNSFIHCSSFFCGGDGLQIVGDYNRWSGGKIEQCYPVDAQGDELPVRVTTTDLTATPADGTTVIYEEETSPGSWSTFTAPTGPGIGCHIRGGDAVQIEGVWFEGLGVDCVTVEGRYHTINKCMVQSPDTNNSRTVRVLGGWRTSVVRCTMGTGTSNRVAVHRGDIADPPASAHLQRYGGSDLQYPFVGSSTSGDEQHGNHHVVAFCSTHSTSSVAGPGVEVDGVEVPQ